MSNTIINTLTEIRNILYKDICNKSKIECKIPEDDSDGNVKNMTAKFILIKANVPHSESFLKLAVYISPNGGIWMAWELPQFVTHEINLKVVNIFDNMKLDHLPSL